MQTVWLWWSSGKDSAWALHTLRQNPELSVERLITTVTPAFGRVAIHSTRLAVLEAQAAAVGLPVQIIELPYPCSNADYEAALKPVFEEAKKADLKYMAFGDLFLADVRAYRERILTGTDIKPLFPLWGQDTAKLAREMIDSGVEAFITCLDPKHLAAEYAGARFNMAFLDSLPETVDPCGENGEFHTCATSGPMFSQNLNLTIGEIVEREGFVYTDFIQT